MTKERLHYIDVAKGILILMVILGHVDGNATALGMTNNAVDDIHRIVNVYVSFYMPCFFFITGYCSNFKNPFGKFFLSSFKSIIIPSVFFTFVFSGAWKLHSEELFYFFRKTILYGGNYWFLSCLFGGRIIYWLLCNHCNAKNKLLLCIFSFVLGFILSPLPQEYEYWWFVHSLCLMPYLCLGQYFRNNSKISNSLSFFKLSIIYNILFCITIVLTRYDIIHKDCFFDVPGVTQGFININLSMFVPLVLLSIVGCFLIIEFSKQIFSNQIFEFLGRNSLVIYCVHSDFLRRSIGWLLKGGGVESNYWTSIILLISAYFATIIMCCGVAWIFNLKYLKYLIGKF